MRVLVAAADPGERARWAAVLGTAGYRVDTADEGESALAQLTVATGPRLAVVDADLARVSGAQICEALCDGRIGSARPAQPYVILVAGGTLTEAARAAEQAGADDWLVRPPDHEMLVARVRVAERVVRLNAQTFHLEARVATRTAELEARTADIARRNEQIVRHQAVLLELAASAGAAPEGTLGRILRADARTLRVERVSFWWLRDRPRRLALENMYLLEQDTFERGLELGENEALAYFRALSQALVIDVPDVRTDARTRELRPGYLDPFGIGAMLDVPVWKQGELAGVVCHEHVGPPRAWTVEEQEFAIAVAHLVALVLEVREHRRSEEGLRDSNQRLRDEVDRLQRALEDAGPPAGGDGTDAPESHAR